MWTMEKGAAFFFLGLRLHRFGAEEGARDGRELPGRAWRFAGVVVLVKAGKGRPADPFIWHGIVYGNPVLLTDYIYRSISSGARGRLAVCELSRSVICTSLPCSASAG